MQPQTHKGTLKCKEGIYEGDLDPDNNRVGYGILKLNNGDKYIGGWYDNKRWGKGEYLFRDGSKYVGCFYRNYKHGTGAFFTSKGGIIHGTWVFGKRCK